MRRVQRSLLFRFYNVHSIPVQCEYEGSRCTERGCRYGNLHWWACAATCGHVGVSSWKYVRCYWLVMPLFVSVFRYSPILPIDRFFGSIFKLRSISLSAHADKSLLIAFSSFGAFWMSYATILLPSSGIVAAYGTNASELHNALGIYLVTCSYL